MGQPFELKVVFRFLTQPLTRVNVIVTRDAARRSGGPGVGTYKDLFLN